MQGNQSVGYISGGVSGGAGGGTASMGGGGGRGGVGVFHYVLPLSTRLGAI